MIVRGSEEVAERTAAVSVAGSLIRGIYFTDNVRAATACSLAIHRQIAISTFHGDNTCSSTR